MAMRLSVLFDGQNARLKKSASEAEGSLNQVKKTALGVAKSIGAAYASYISVGQIIDVTKRYERLQAQLTTATGSLRNQAAAFAALRDFAFQTGQDLDAVTQGFTKLVNLGLNPSREALEAYANVAAGTGKTTIDFIEAVADAATAEFERLKEFGIKARNEGDTVSFTFRGVTKTVENSAEAIENYLIQLGQVEFAGAVANQAQTLEAKINRLGMTWDEFVYQISQAGAGGLIADSIELATAALEELTGMMASGQLSGYIAAWGNQFVSTANDVRQAIHGLNSELQDSGTSFEDIGDFLVEAAQEFPANITAITRILGVELAAVVDLAGIYGEQFKQIIILKIRELIARVGLYTEELKDKLNPFDGDTFDLDGQLSQVKEANDAQIAQFRATADQRLEIARNTRLGIISEILAERDATVATYRDQVAEADKLRKEWEANRKAQAATDLSQFSKAAGGNNADSPGNKARREEFDKLVESLKSEEQKLRESYEKRRQIILANTAETSAQRTQLLQQLDQQYDEQRLAEFNKVVEGLKTEEQKLLESYQRRRQIILDSTAETSAARAALLQQLDQQYGEQVLQGYGDRPEQQSIETQIQNINAEFEIRRQAILANTQLTEEARTQLETELTKRRNAQIAALENQKMNMVLSSGAQLFGGLADLARTFGGEQSKAYKTMFAITKGFSIAQGILNLSTAISNASALPFPANIPAMATAAATGAKLIQDIKGATYQGQAHNGINYVPGSNEGTWLLKKGEMVLNNKQRDNFEYLVDYAKNGSGGTNAGGTVIHIHNKIEIDAQGAAPGTEQAISEAMDAATQRMKEELAEDFSNGGPLAQRLSGRGIAA